MLHELQPVFTNEILRDCDEQLYRLLLGIKPIDWMCIAAYEDWTVKDVFSHLVDVIIRRLSSLRDGTRLNLDAPIKSYDELVEYIDKLADQWVSVTRRVSPRVLLTLFNSLNEELYEYFISCDPFGEGIAVAWAGETHSAVWFDQAREYAEHWIHQQQIRNALLLPPIIGQKHWEAMVDISVRCLPSSYLNIHRPDGTTLGITVAGVVSREYCLVQEAQRWKLYTGKAEKVTARCICDAKELCFGLTGLADMRFFVEGDIKLAATIKTARALMTKT